jgi:hypothetical protein
LLRAYIQGSLYIGRVNTGPAAGVAARLAAGLTVGCAASVIEVAGYAGALWAVLAVLIAWFKRFLVLNQSARALMRWRPWLIARQ